MNPAREAALGGGVPVTVPAMTVNRVCGSGAQAIVSGAQEIQLGLHDVAIAGGMENMDRAPYLVDGGRWGYRMRHATLLDSMLRDRLNDAFYSYRDGIPPRVRNRPPLRVTGNVTPACHAADTLLPSGRHCNAVEEKS